MHAFPKAIWDPEERARRCDTPPLTREQRMMFDRLMRTQPGETLERMEKNLTYSFWSAKRCACQIIAEYLAQRDFYMSKCVKYQDRFWKNIDQFHSRDCGCDSKTCAWMRNVNTWTSERPAPCPLSAVLPSFASSAFECFNVVPGNKT